LSTETSPPEKDIREQVYQSESHLRSILKALSWRFVATFSTIVIAWFFTGEIDTALKVGAVEFVLKFLIYYLHERAWQLVPRGTIRGMFRH
jgi:uncharacterized membrane protein